ncbi:membrane protein involved in the export of O-antigen and teichoic acid [Idiomarina sp. A28L]|uniref:lipopolysaccharide biosynthesis protein n=1 Tax=Idiomarina sp. A28L TaxID=1036674 RepID=UPI0002138CBA|nr:lipopolysaccharide biosynthesis protein [Idiomarina sp. A28L]EGN74610.1 membrane protein involved in the export of O-antigen and teichoic acid [Idiomarina sp. A28L]
MNARKVLAFSVGPIGGAALGLITLPIVAWFFSPEDIGRLTMLQVAVSFALLLFSLGLDKAYVREFHEVEDKAGLLKAVFIPGFVILLLVLAGLVFSPWSPSLLLFGIDSLFLTVLLYASILLSFGSRFLGLILRMQERGFEYSMSQLLPKLLFLQIVLGYVWLGADAVFDNLIMANFLSLLAVFLIYAWTTRKDWLPALNAIIDKAKQSQMIRYAIPLIGSGLAFWGLTIMDKLFLRALSGFEELGIYAVAITFGGAALVFQAIFSTIWVPVVYKWVAEGVNPQKIKHVIDYVTLAVVAIWSLAGMFSWVVAYLLPPEYMLVPYILLAAMAYPLLYTLSEATGIGIGIKRRSMFSLLAAILALIVNAIGNWYLIPTYGAAGAAMASAIAFMVFFIIRTEASSRLWESFERRRMYVFVIVLIIFSVFFNTIAIERLSFVVFFYFLVLVASLFAYKRQLLEGSAFCINKLFKR